MAELFEHQKIEVNGKIIIGISLKMQDKSLVVLRGERGYVMCGYLNLDAAEKFKDVAVIVKGVSTVEAALNSVVADCTSFAAKLGIHKSQPIKEVLKIIC